MTRILISSIGTGQKQEGGYRTAIYEYLGKRKETPFISKALSEFLNIDRLYLIGTKKSIWDSVYSQFGGENREIEDALWEKQETNTTRAEDLEIVNKQIDKFLGSSGSQCFLIKYGINEEELWSNFEIYLEILDKIEQGDEVYIDISHSFRSLALMSFLMAQFGQTIREKDFKIAGIFYGMLDYSRENNGITPIVDLKMFFELIEWMKAVENLTKYGNADYIVELLQGENKKEINLFSNFSLSLRMANLAAIKDNVRRLAQQKQFIENSNNKVVSLLSKEINNFIQRLNKEKMSDFQLELSKWFCEHKHYALGYLALVEAIISKVCEIKNYDLTKRDNREKAKKEMKGVHKELYYKVFKSANEIRKDIAHQIGNRKESLISDARSLKSFLNKTEKIFKELQ